MAGTLEISPEIAPLALLRPLAEGERWSIELSPDFNAPEISALMAAISHAGFPVKLAHTGDGYVLQPTTGGEWAPSGEWLLLLLTG